MGWGGTGEKTEPEVSVSRRGGGREEGGGGGARSIDCNDSCQLAWYYSYVIRNASTRLANRRIRRPGRPDWHLRINLGSERCRRRSSYHQNFTYGGPQWTLRHALPSMDREPEALQLARFAHQVWTISCRPHSDARTPIAWTPTGDGTKNDQW